MTILTSKGPPFGKKSKISKNQFFFKKLYFFFLNLYSTCSKLSFEVYNSHVSKNFKFWPIFMWKISFFATVFWQPAWPKLQFKKCYFWCLWALECLMTASGWLKSIQAIMAPPCVIMSFQSSCEIGFNNGITFMNSRYNLDYLELAASFKSLNTLIESSSIYCFWEIWQNWRICLVLNCLNVRILSTHMSKQIDTLKLT